MIALALVLLAQSAIQNEFAMPTPHAAFDVPPAATEGVDVVEHLGEKPPLDDLFADSDGAPAHVAQYLAAGRPVVLTFSYTRCKMLCDLLLSSLSRTLRDTGLVLGKDYVAVDVTMDPTETPADAAQERRMRLQAIGAPPDAPWAFLVGREEEIGHLAKAVGFGFRYDGLTGQFAHPIVVVVLSPDGTIARYLYGLPQSPRDLRLALVEASHGTVGTTTDRLLLTCYHWDPATRRYGWFVAAYFRVAGVLLMGLVGGLLGLLIRHERRKARRS